MLIAEAPQFTGEDILLALFALLVFTLVPVLTVVYGFRWAAQAARGSRSALIAFIVVVGAEVLAFVAAVATELTAATWPALIIAAQAVVFLRARRAEPPAE